MEENFARWHPGDTPRNKGFVVARVVDCCLFHPARGDRAHSRRVTDLQQSALKKTLQLAVTQVFIRTCAVDPYFKMMSLEHLAELMFHRTPFGSCLENSEFCSS